MRVCLQISGVVYMFRYPPQTALAVGLSMAQIGEFAFVLLSVASQLGLMPYQVYMLLMGEPLPHPVCPSCLRLDPKTLHQACDHSQAARVQCIIHCSGCSR